MNELKKIIKDRKCLVFFDLEGTQYTHEIIQIGAYKVYIRDDLSIKKIFKPFSIYVKPKAKIGNFVSQLTGITPKIIKNEGVPFRVALQSFKSYVGKDFNKSLYFAFGPSDRDMILASLDNNLDANKDDAHIILKYYFDYSNFISKYIQDENGSSMSLNKCINFFNIKFDGTAHDASADAYNLLKLFEAFNERKDVVEKEYLKTLLKNKKLPLPILHLMKRIENGESVSYKDFESEVHDFLK